MARGIDVATIALVVNYDLPITKDRTDRMVVSPITYVHRTGRAGRFGRKCVAVSMVSEEADVRDMEKIKEYVNNKFWKDLFQDVQIGSLYDVVATQLKDKKADTEVEEEERKAATDMRETGKEMKDKVDTEI